MATTESSRGIIPGFRTGSPLFNGLYQLGFVTADLDAAQHVLGRRFGITRFRVKRDPDPARISTAHAYAGDMMVEIIEPGPDAEPVFFTEGPPPVGGARFHHHGFNVAGLEEWAQIERQVAEAGWATPIKGSILDGDLRYMYADTRAELGCYSEYVYRAGAALTFYDDVPHN